MTLWTDLTIRLHAVRAILFGLAVTIAHADENFPTPRAPWTTSRLQGTPDPPSPYRIEPVFPELRFERPTSIEQFPDQERLLVTQIDGKIFTFLKNSDVPAAELVVDLRSLLPSELAGQEVSLFDAEFHPGFRENRYLFVCYVHPGQGRHTRLARLSLSKDLSPRFVPGSELVLMTWPSGPHNAGCLEFGRDGCLYISTGDGAGPNPPDGLTTGQDLSDLLGAILRINVDLAGAGRAYTVPSDNPFVGLDGARPEIWAYGLRNPWKFGTDPETENIFAADNGWESWEMVHRIVRGGNCGWPVMEGRAALRTEVTPGPTPIIPPVKDHPHTEANSVIGGPVYRGDKLPELVGSFVYGDYITGTIWAIRSDTDGAFSHTTLTDTDQRIVAFTQGSHGELYVLDYDFTGQVYELRPSGLEDTSSRFPRRLSETGLFSSLLDLEPAAGVVPYAVQVQRWMDGAEAQRWVAIPGTGQIRLSVKIDTPASYPEGTVLAKHLRWPLGNDRKPIRLETQILHYENQQWHPYSYLWDDAGEDAYLVEAIGADRPLRVPDANAPSGFSHRTWHVSAMNECKLCHNPGSQFVLGFSPHELNWSPADTGETNQLVALAGQKVLAEAPVITSDDPSRLVDPHDASQDLDKRARSYLHTNCGICHHPRGSAIVSFYLRRDMPFRHLNTNKGTIIGTFGMQDPKIIVPGDPYRSVLFYRMAKLGYARMPYIGSHVVDSTGVALIEQWIRSLPSDASKSFSPPVTEGSVESRALSTLTHSTSAPRAQRDRALRELVKSTEGALALVARMHRGSLTQADFQAAVQLGSEARTNDIHGLIESFVPESQRRKRLGPTISPDSILGKDGDLARGKLIYFSDTARCRACHEIDAPSESLGPTLVEINKKYPRPADLLQHVLQPSLKIDDQFATYTVLTDDGRAITGLVASDTDKELTMKTAERKIVRLARDNIEEMQRIEKSLMPDFLLSDLTPQEAADLLEYLRAQR